MHWFAYFVRRAIGHLWKEPLLSGATVLTLAVAFLCFCSFLAVALGVGGLADRWTSDFHVALYIRDGVPDAEVRRVADAVARLGEVERTTVVPSARMRERLLAGMGEDPALASLEPRLFPTTIEVRLSERVRDAASVAVLAERLAALEVVDQVETYGDLFQRLSAVTAIARSVAVALGLIVLLATLLVVSNTVRLSMLGRREEIEIQRLCGATDRFIKVPFLLAGAAQGGVGAAFALGLLAATGLLVQRAIGSLLPVMPDHEMSGLPIAASAVVLVAGTLLGLAGAHLSVTRFLRSAP
jgi:cell division transport system permease protein